MNYWILKTEPSTYSLEDLRKEKKTEWGGVRNFQARNNIRAMKPGDFAVIYESGGPKAAVGLAKVSGLPHQELKSDAQWSAVEISFVQGFQKHVTLSQIKADPILSQMLIARNPRISVSPLSKEAFSKILQFAGASLK